MDTTLSVLATTVMGLMVGVEVSVARVINPITLALPAGPSMAARAHAARMLGRVMPFWYIASLILAGALAFVSWGRPAATPAVLAGVLLAISVVMSVAWLVPLNNRAKTWTPEDHPSDWRALQGRWDRLHGVRIVVIVAAFALIALAGASL